MIINLNNIEVPKPTEKMLGVLENIFKYCGVDISTAREDFTLASTLIEQHQEQMHAKVSRCCTAYVSRSRNTNKPKEGDRKYYADATCRYDSDSGRYVEEYEYDKVIRRYGSYANKRIHDELEELKREELRRQMWGD